MSAVVKPVFKAVGRTLGIGGSSRPADTPRQAQAEAAGGAPQPAAMDARVATPEERRTALRRRRGARALLSEERVDAESGLGGMNTTLGGM